MAITYGSVCSGIEAASVAWEQLGFIPAWFAEIEEFPSAVLAHHWPDVRNLGDMTAIADKVKSGDVEAPDILVGGTPCQAFSIGGLRAGLSDPRGQLTISYMDLANAVDEQRTKTGKPPSIIIWENVPGVLSSIDNAFGCFLAGLAGEDEELQPPGKRWTNAGCVYGPKRSIAWIVKNAEYFGVAQRRKRVLLIASARAGIDPAKILFEPEGLFGADLPTRTSPVPVCLTARGAGSLDDRETYIVTETGRIRHLTPLENERQMGFPDNHTMIPYRGKTDTECPDRPRYKAIGNSMAVPVMRWIGGRILQHLNNIQIKETIMSEPCELIIDEKEAKDSWRTPKAVYNKLNAEFKFAGDVAASSDNHLHSRFLTKEADALTVDWHQYFLFGQGYGYVFCNPPYSSIDPWVEKAAEEVKKGLGTVMLVHADPSVKWFLKATQSASEIIFINGRLQFDPADNNQNQSRNTRGSALLIWNPFRSGDCVTRYIRKEALFGNEN